MTKQAVGEAVGDLARLGYAERVADALTDSPPVGATL